MGWICRRRFLVLSGEQKVADENAFSLYRARVGLSAYASRVPFGSEARRRHEPTAEGTKGSGETTSDLFQQQSSAAQ
jgi:hypothetical protein